MRSVFVKEWRESRALILGFLLLAPLAALGLRWYLAGIDRTGEEAVAFLVPGLLALFTLSVGADLFAADLSSGRARFLAALPVRPSAVWAGKVVFLFVSATLYLGLCLAVERIVFGSVPSRYQVMLVVVIGAAGAATVFWSTLVDRGIAAALAGAGSVALIGFLLTRLGRAGIDMSPVTGNACLAGLLITAGFLAGSFVAFTRGRVHLGSRLRRAVLAAAAFLLVTAPPVAWAGISVIRYRHLTPESEGLGVTVVDLRDDGRWAIVMVQRKNDGPLGVRAAGALWAVRISDGFVRELQTENLLWAGFTPDGRMAVARTDPLPGEKRGVTVASVIDPETGAVESTRAVDGSWAPYRHVDYGPLTISFGQPIRVLDGASRELARLPKDTVPFPVGAPWGLVVNRFAAGQSHMGVFVLAEARTVPLRAAPFLLPERPDGDLWRVDKAKGKGDDALVRFRLDGSPEEMVLSGRANGWRWSPDGRLAIVVFDGRAHLLRSSGDGPEEIPGVETGKGDAFVYFSPRSDSALVVGRDGAFAVRFGGGPPEAAPVHFAALPGGCEAGTFTGEGLLRPDFNSGELFFHSLDGTLRRLLPR